MAEGRAAKPRKRQTATGAAGKASGAFSDEEKAAMKERAKEQKAAARRGPRAGKAAGEADALAKIAEMPDGERAMAERLHAIVKETAPELAAKTWYGMPAYAKDGDVICFFQSAHKFKSRYATLGFSDKAKLDEGAMWPSSYALVELTPAVEKSIAALVGRAVG